MADSHKRAALTGPGIMILSALLFGYFGFFTSWTHRYTLDDPPQLLIMVVVLEWALKGGAIAFGASALLLFASGLAGNLLYAAAGIVTAIAFLAVGIWDWTTPYSSGFPPFILILFAAWNGWGSWESLRDVLSLNASRAGSELADARR